MLSSERQGERVYYWTNATNIHCSGDSWIARAVPGLRDLRIHCSGPQTVLCDNLALQAGVETTGKGRPLMDEASWNSKKLQVEISLHVGMAPPSPHLITRSKHLFLASNKPQLGFEGPKAQLEPQERAQPPTLLTHRSSRIDTSHILSWALAP